MVALSDEEIAFVELELDDEDAEDKFDHLMGEAVKRKIIKKQRKRKVRFFSDKEGFKVVKKNGRFVEVKVSPKEARKRSKSAKISAKKFKTKRDQGIKRFK